MVRYRRRPRATVVKRAGIGLLIAGALTVVIFVIASFLGFGAPSGGNAAKPLASCPKVAPVIVPTVVGSISVPAGPIAGYCQPQLVNAAQVMRAGITLGIGQHTQTVGVMTAIGESGLRNLDHGDAAGADSRGIFQQRANGAWGGLVDRMDPYTASYNFFNRLIRVRGWKTMAPSALAHAVQTNADPDYYTQYWQRAKAVVDALSKRESSN